MYLLLKSIFEKKSSCSFDAYADRAKKKRKGHYREVNWQCHFLFFSFNITMRDIYSRSNAVDIPTKMQQNNRNHNHSKFNIDHWIIWMCVFLFVWLDSGEIVIAKFNYTSQESHELTISKNERLLLLDDSCLWWKVKRVDSDETG